MHIVGAREPLYAWSYSHLGWLVERNNGRFAVPESDVLTWGNPNHNHPNPDGPHPGGFCVQSARLFEKRFCVRIPFQTTGESLAPHSARVELSECWLEITTAEICLFLTDRIICHQLCFQVLESMQNILSTPPGWVPFAQAGGVLKHINFCLCMAEYTRVNLILTS